MKAKVILALAVLGLMAFADAQEPATTPCDCPRIYSPVCGSKTYSNMCEANCAGVTATNTGVCAGDPAPPVIGER